jgi:hypothetical protein
MAASDFDDEWPFRLEMTTALLRLGQAKSALIQERVSMMPITSILARSRAATP